MIEGIGRPNPSPIRLPVSNSTAQLFVVPKSIPKWSGIVVLSAQSDVDVLAFEFAENLVQPRQQQGA